MADKPSLIINRQANCLHMGTSSTLLRSWAPLLTFMRIYDDSCFSPGFAKFLTAATCLQTMCLECSSVVAVAQAERILSGCKQIRELHVSGACILHKLPPAVETLTMQFPGDYTPDEQELDVLLPSAFVHKLVDLTCLRELTLMIQLGVVRLDCHLRIPGLELLVVDFGLWDDTIVDLSWLRAQACERLHIGIHTHASELEAHSDLTDQLQQLAISELRLQVSHYFPLELQHVWQRVKASTGCCINFEHHGLVPGTREACALEALPCSPSVHLIILQGPTWAVQWTAFSARAARYSICTMPGVALSIVGGCDLPTELQSLPWQLVIHSSSVRGFHSAVTRLVEGFPIHHLQNAAAVAAGWTIDR